MKHTLPGKAVSLISILLVLLLLCSCQKSAAQNPADLVGQIKSQSTFTELSALSGDKLSSYFQFRDTDVKRFSALISVSGESADTIAAFEVTDKGQYDVVITGITQYLTNLSSSFRNTMEGEYKKVQNRVLVEMDQVIILVICSDSAAIEKHLTGRGAKSIY